MKKPEESCFRDNNALKRSNRSEAGRNAKQKIELAGIRLVEAAARSMDEWLGAFRRFYTTFTNEYTNYLLSLSRSDFSGVNLKGYPFDSFEMAGAFLEYAASILFDNSHPKEGERSPCVLYRLCIRYSPEKARESAEFPFFEYLRMNVWKGSVHRWNKERLLSVRNGIVVPDSYDKAMSKYMRENRDTESAESDTQSGVLREAILANNETYVASLDDEIFDGDGNSQGTLADSICDTSPDFAMAIENKNRTAELMITTGRLLQKHLTEEQYSIYSHVITVRLINSIVNVARIEFCSELDYRRSSSDPEKRKYISELKKQCAADNSMLRTDEGWDFLNIDKRIAEDGCAEYPFFQPAVLEWFKNDRKLVTQKRISGSLGVSESQITKMCTKIEELLSRYKYLCFGE